MSILLYLVFLGVALYWVSKILLPEMRKPSLPNIPKVKKVDPIEFSASDEPENRIKKLETLLAEKTKNIQLLQTELQAFFVQIRDFDKVKVLLEEEVHRLKEQNRMLRSELGLPTTVQPKEHSIT